MRFLVDECTGPSVASWLRSLGYDVYSVYDQNPGMSDKDIIEKAHIENRVIITNDKDFGEMVYRIGKTHAGVILLRLEDERSKSKKQILSYIIENYQGEIDNSFIVATEQRIRIARKIDKWI